ncbi:divalent-cation tolerance protein CutA [Vampirovibrio sp.]|uniref:divalent-cation tolerance protein CutA n=1 Tax=Vampirovibrio sp. TaxID=2717857 RepID=UPI0035943938
MTLTENPDACIVLVTCGHLAEAEMIARSIVTEKLAACVNLIGEDSPIRSFYQWNGKLEESLEILLLIKTRLPLLEALQNRIRELHAYEVFEFMVLGIQAGSPDYLAWLTEGTMKA